MTTRGADDAKPGSLAAMLAVDGDAARAWAPEELAAVLRHQLAAPLAADLVAGPPGLAEEVGRLSPDAGAGLVSFADLLHDPSPPVVLLTSVKDFAKASRDDPAAALPKEVAAVLYFAAIIVARRRCGRVISRLGPEALAAGVEWVLAQPWVDPATRSLFEAGAHGSAG